MKFKSTDGSGSLAAAYLVFTTALVGGSLFTGITFHQHPEVPIVVLGVGGTLALLTLVLRMRPELPSDCFWLFVKGRRPADPAYVPRLIKNSPARFGTNRPPTVEEIRELKEDARTWVPSRAGSARSTLRR